MVTGGIFHDCAVHDIDMICWLVGEYPTSVYTVAHAHIDAIRSLNDVDTVVISMKFRDGTLATIDLSRYAAYGYDQRLEVWWHSQFIYSIVVCFCQHVYFLICCLVDRQSHMVRVCDKNGRRTITTESVTLSHRTRKKSGSTTKYIDDVHQRRCCRARYKHTASSGTYKRLHGVDLCQHHHHCKMMEDKERRRRRSLSLSSIVLQWWWCWQESTPRSSVSCKFHCLLYAFILLCNVFFDARHQCLWLSTLTS